MPARSIGKATISFGLVSIPIKLFSTGESSGSISFHWLHRDCGTRVKQQYYCPKDEVTVPRGDMIKGYEFAKGKYVTFTEDELKALLEPPSKSIDIEEFIPVSQIDPVYFDKAYYLGPDKGGERPYHLLSEVMRKTDRVAVARYAARGKQYLVMVRPYDDGLIMQQLRYADEVKPFAEIPVGESKVKPQEVKLAQQLVEQISHKSFKPESYEDDVKKRIMSQIEQKIAGEEVTFAEDEQPQAQIIDLMDALKASLGGSDTLKKPKPAKRAVPKAVKKKKKAAKKKKA